MGILVSLFFNGGSGLLTKLEIIGKKRKYLQKMHKELAKLQRVGKTANNYQNRN